MKTDKKINGRTLRQNNGLWDLMDQRSGVLTGKIVYTGTIQEIVEELVPVGATVSVTGTDEYGLLATVVKVLSDGDCDLRFNDGEEGTYSTDEFEVVE